MVEQHRDQVVALPASATAEDGFLAVVVPSGDLGENVACLDRPAGQGAGGLLDIVLGVMADAEREQLHQLAGQVLVWVPLAIGRRIQPDKQRRVVDDGAEQLPERLAGQLAEDSFCRRMAGRLSTLTLLVAKWLCHISVSRSPSGSGPNSIR